MLAVCEKPLAAGFLFYTRRFCPSVYMVFRMYYFLAFVCSVCTCLGLAWPSSQLTTPSAYNPVNSQTLELINSRAYKLTNSQTHELINSRAHKVTNSQTHKLINSQAHKVTKHITPLSPWRGVGGEALHSFSPLYESLG